MENTIGAGGAGASRSSCGSDGLHFCMGVQPLHIPQRSRYHPAGFGDAAPRRQIYAYVGMQVGTLRTPDADRCDLVPPGMCAHRAWRRSANETSAQSMSTSWALALVWMALPVQCAERATSLPRFLAHARHMTVDHHATVARHFARAGGATHCEMTTFPQRMPNAVRTTSRMWSTPEQGNLPTSQCHTRCPAMQAERKCARPTPESARPACARACARAQGPSQQQQEAWVPVGLRGVSHRTPN